MNSAEGFSVNNVAQQERAHPQADSSEVPAMIDWVLLISGGPEKAGDEGPFPQPFSVSSEGDRPGPHEGATHPASQASRCFLQDPRFSQLFHRKILSDYFNTPVNLSIANALRQTRCLLLTGINANARRSDFHYL